MILSVYLLCIYCAYGMTTIITSVKVSYKYNYVQYMCVHVCMHPASRPALQNMHAQVSWSDNNIVSQHQT